MSFPCYFSLINYLSNFFAFPRLFFPLFIFSPPTNIRTMFIIGRYSAWFWWKRMRNWMRGGVEQDSFKKKCTFYMTFFFKLQYKVDTDVTLYERELLPSCYCFPWQAFYSCFLSLPFFDEKSSTWSFYENVYHSSSDDGNGMDGLYITSYTLFSFPCGWYKCVRVCLCFLQSYNLKALYGIDIYVRC